MEFRKLVLFGMPLICTLSCLPSSRAMDGLGNLVVNVQKTSKTTEDLVLRLF